MSFRAARDRALDWAECRPRSFLLIVAILLLSWAAILGAVAWEFVRRVIEVVA